MIAMRGLASCSCLMTTVKASEGQPTVHVGNGRAVSFNQAMDDATFDFLTADAANIDDLFLVVDGSIPEQKQ